jgi:hypothetical protein
MITVELTEQELAVLSGLMDLGVKAGGLQVATAAAQILAKLESAVAQARLEKEAQPT